MTSSLHTLLLLADSALPLGSFAFSSGLESYLAHRKVGKSSFIRQATLQTFLDQSVHALASTALPYMLSSYRNPGQLFELDNDFDASTPCAVARRASIAQGRALLNVWEKSFLDNHLSHNGAHAPRILHDTVAITVNAAAILQAFVTSVRSSSAIFSVNAHFAPLWGVITLSLGVDWKSSAYIFLFSHARTVISAAVRANVVGPYQAHTLLACPDLDVCIRRLISTYATRQIEDAGQSMPIVDLWVGRHEKLYSRIFNS